MPRRYQRQRTKGFHLPPGTVCVTRKRKNDPGPYGNPFRLQHKDRRYRSRRLAEVAVMLFEAYYAPDLAFRARLRHELRGKNLACYCKLDWPCHADVELAWANTDE